ncbi:hypothetical protein KEM56_002872 [Ascosphaera pollenicola]|nr:hypothetical protein KEM56_002872 [Ascosphaera pollenicola]
MSSGAVQKTPLRRSARLLARRQTPDPATQPQSTAITKRRKRRYLARRRIGDKNCDTRVIVRNELEVLVHLGMITQNSNILERKLNFNRISSDVLSGALDWIYTGKYEVEKYLNGGTDFRQTSESDVDYAPRYHMTMAQFASLSCMNKLAEHAEEAARTSLRQAFEPFDPELWYLFAVKCLGENGYDEGKYGDLLLDVAAQNWDQLYASPYLERVGAEYRCDLLERHLKIKRQSQFTEDDSA